MSALGRASGGIATCCEADPTRAGRGCAPILIGGASRSGLQVRLNARTDMPDRDVYAQFELWCPEIERYLHFERAEWRPIRPLCSGSTRTLKVGNVLLKIRGVLPQSMAKLTPARERLLALLAASPEGYSEESLRALGFGIMTLARLVRSGLAVAEPRTLGRTTGVLHIRITEAGRRAIDE
jgi:hypothetical protein